MTDDLDELFWNMGVCGDFVVWGVYDRIKTKLKGLSPVKYRNLVLGQKLSPWSNHLALST